MFEKAARLKIRFNCKGQISVEDLWDLSVKELDTIFKGLTTELKEQKKESLLEQKTRADEILELQICIVKHIVEVKLEEQRAWEDKASKAMQRQKMLGIIAEKQDEGLRNMSIEDLTKLINDLK